LFVFLTARDDEEPSKMLRVCYITNWSRYRSGEAKFEIEFVDPFMCSHIIYAYATVDERKPEIIPIQKDDLGLKKIFEKKTNLFLINFLEHYRELALLKKRNPDLKISIRLGGKIAQYTRYLKHSNTATQLVRSLIW
jgi:GH18 family chitinase